MGGYGCRRGQITSRGLHLPLAGLKPLRQGELDGLCGLYAGINALRLLFAAERPLSRRQVKALFETGIVHLADIAPLPAAIVGGLEHQTWEGLLQALVTEVTRMTGRTILVTRPLRKVTHPSRSKTFDAMESAIRGMHPVLIELSGVHQHFTVVCGYSASRLVLFDSGTLYWLTCRSCTVRTGQTRRRHIINPRSLTVLALHRG